MRKPTTVPKAATRRGDEKNVFRASILTTKPTFAFSKMGSLGLECRV